MMFTLSAPALAESTDALRQLSTSAKSAVSVLDAENTMEAPAEQLNLCDGSITVYIGEDGQQYAQQGGGEARQISNLYVTTHNIQTTNTLTIKGGSVAAKVKLENVNINTSGAAVSVSGDVELYIEGRSTLQSGEECAGIQKEDDGHLKIDGSGSLEVHGGTNSAGIGGGSAKNKGCGRNITINGGDITAIGGDQGAGIGGGYAWGRSAEGHGEYITINDGNVTAIGGNGGAGIGGGSIVRFNDSDGGHGQYITINGGIVKAVAGSNAFAIGAGQDGWGRYITINGGDVTVQAENRWIGGRHGEVDKKSLNGAITYLDKDGNVVDAINWGITVNETEVNGVNYKNILGDGVLCYDIAEKVLKLQDGKFFNGDLTITAPNDVSIDLEADASHVVNGNLTVTGAKDVKVTKLASGDAAAAIEGKAEIACSGDVLLRNLGGESSSGRNLIKNGLTVKRADTVTTEGLISGETIIDCTGNIELGNEWGTTVSKLTVNSANNVTVTSGSVYCSIGKGAEIKCSGTVKISGTSEDRCRTGCFACKCGYAFCG